MNSIPYIVSVVANIVMLILLIKAGMAYGREMMDHQKSLGESIESAKRAINRLHAINEIHIQDENLLLSEVIFWSEVLDMSIELDVDEFAVQLIALIAEYEGDQDE